MRRIIHGATEGTNGISTTSRQYKRRLKEEGTSKETGDANYTHVLFYILLTAFVVASLVTRLYKLNEPTHIAWDETHFGKHASWYIKGQFFFDVHPPLGKMLIAFAGFFSGYNGSFEFKEPGVSYEDYPYYGMRLLCALCGFWVVPLAYLCVWELTKSLTASVLSGLLVLCDIGTLTLSQYILLDPILLCFIMWSTYSTFKFCNCKMFELDWWMWMSIAGFSLGCAFSVKWVGLFVIALAGLRTIRDLWDLLGDLRNTKEIRTYHMRSSSELETLSPTMQFIKKLAEHFFARALCLIGIPLYVYVSVFIVHFAALRNSGNGDGFFSSAFQSSLIGNELHELLVPEYLAYGAVITLKNHRGGGGLLHSHSHLYPEGEGSIQQQQITAYSHKDDNNKWIVKKASGPLDDAAEVEFVLNGDEIILEHMSTHRNLHSHTEKAPMTKSHYQVTGYGQEGVGDSNDHWVVELVKGQPGDKIKTVTSLLKLHHKNVGCYLHSHSTQLPKWGWEQLEVSCNPFVDITNNVLWNIEGNVHPKLPNVEGDFFQPSFVSKFLESHIVMAESNNNMKPKEGEVTSKPWHWPINYQGQHFSGGGYRVYLLGNPVRRYNCIPGYKMFLRYYFYWIPYNYLLIVDLPVLFQSLVDLLMQIVFWGNGILLILYVIVLILDLMIRQRGVQYSPFIQERMDRYLHGAGWMFIGWTLHYLPFYLMGRVLYFHHYFPALMFSCMLSGITLEFLITMFKSLFNNAVIQSVLYHFIVGVIISVVIGSFYLFMPLAYGMQGDKSHLASSEMYGLKWLDTWDF